VELRDRTKDLQVLDLGRVPYEKAWKYQKELVENRRRGEIGDSLVFVEHPPVLTLGRSWKRQNILADTPALTEKGVEVYEVERGGDVTYHGPGQVVGYPIVNLADRGRDLHRYLRDLEEVILRVVGSYGLEARRHEGLTGVWVGEEKVCAFGVAVRSWVTYHGFALNVNTDLSFFNLIHPCGIQDMGVTSLAKLQGHWVDPEEVKARIAEAFAQVFGYSLEEAVTLA
jgi:lipoate-protein ligase B